MRATLWILGWMFFGAGITLFVCDLILFLKRKRKGKR